MALRTYAFGAAALSAARIFQLAASFAAVPVLTRLLPPSEFGLVALALAVTSFMLYMGDAGLAKSLVRTDVKDTEIWSSVFWATLLFTGALSLILLALAWPTAIFFGETRLVAMLVVLASLPLFQGVMAAPTAELTKRERFMTLAASEFISGIAGVAIALILAFKGFGAWALVMQQVAIWGVKGAVIVGASKFRPRAVFAFDRLGEHMIFARDTMGFAITSYLGRQTDTLVVGKLLGTAALGVYSIAFRIMSLPAHLVGGAIQSALFPKFVQLKDDLPRLRQVVLTSTTVQAAFVFPGMAVIAAASHAFFTLLLSPRWEAAAIIFALMAPGGALQTVTNLNGVLLQAVGRTGARLRLTVEYAIIWVIAAIPLSMISLPAVAAGFSLLSLLYLPRLLHLYLTPIGCTWREYARALAGPTALSIAIFFAHIALVRILHPAPLAEVALAVLELMAAYGAYALLQWKQLKRDFQEMRTIFAQSAPQNLGNSAVS